MSADARAVMAEVTVRAAIPRRRSPRLRRYMDARMAEWNRWQNLRSALMRARVRRKNARSKIGQLEHQLAIHREHEREATQQVLELWPQLPPEQRGVFNDDLEQGMDEQLREAAE